LAATISGGRGPMTTSKKSDCTRIPFLWLRNLDLLPVKHDADLFYDPARQGTLAERILVWTSVVQPAQREGESYENTSGIPWQGFSTTSSADDVSAHEMFEGRRFGFRPRYFRRTWFVVSPMGPISSQVGAWCLSRIQVWEDGSYSR